MTKRYPLIVFLFLTLCLLATFPILYAQDKEPTGMPPSDILEKTILSRSASYEETLTDL